jgi:hypothetical protein
MGVYKKNRMGVYKKNIKKSTLDGEMKFISDNVKKIAEFDHCYLNDCVYVSFVLWVATDDDKKYVSASYTIGSCYDD